MAPQEPVAAANAQTYHVMTAVRGGEVEEFFMEEHERWRLVTVARDL